MIPFLWMQPKLKSYLPSKNIPNVMSLLFYMPTKSLLISSISSPSKCLSCPLRFFLPSCWSNNLSTKLLEVATSTGRRRSVFLALISAPNSSSKFTISVQDCWAAACNGVSQYLPFCTSAPTWKWGMMVCETNHLPQQGEADVSATKRTSILYNELLLCMRYICTCRFHKYASYIHVLNLKMQ